MVGEKRIRLKPNDLSVSDIERLSTFWGEDGNLVGDYQEVRGFISHLKDNYRIYDFPIFDLIPWPADDSEMIPLYYRSTYFHASMIYLYLHLALIGRCPNENEQNEIIIHIVNYCWELIGKIEREADSSDKQDTMIRVNLIFFVTYIIYIGYRQNDIELLIQGYNKLLSILSMIPWELISSLKIGEKRNIGNIFLPMEKLIERSNFLLNENRSYFIRNPKMLKCIIEAINFSFDTNGNH